MFYLGIHQPHWLTQTTVPLFMSRRRLIGRAKFPRTVGRWALDSGAFTEIKDHGKWTVDARTYAADVRRFRDEIGGMDWAAIQDWMCEPHMLAKTGMTIADHQRLTAQSYADLLRIAPEVPGCRATGLAQRRLPGPSRTIRRSWVRSVTLPNCRVGSVCRRQATDEFAAIVRALVANGISLHGFGVKLHGLLKVAPLLKSSDSLAWSFTARRLQRPGLPQCIGSGHKNCANCLPFALAWHKRLLASLPPSWQLPVKRKRAA